jgi:lysyl-tRNA synthetase class 2
MKQRIRAYFAAAHVLEVDTPVLSPYAVSDPQIESLEVTRCQVSERPLYLHTSPEFYMKRLLAADYPDIYSMCRVFRDGESGRHHQPEFTMLEWYRHGMALDEIVADTVGVIRAALDRDIDVDSIDYRDAFIAACGLDPLVADNTSLADAAEADDALRAAVGDERDDRSSATTLPARLRWRVCVRMTRRSPTDSRSSWVPWNSRTATWN